MSMLGLSKNKHKEAGLGYCPILAVYLDYFDPRKCDETDKSKDIVKTKWPLTNSFNHNLKGDKILEERFKTWRKHDIGDSLHR